VLGLIPAALQPPPADAPPVQISMLYGYLLGLFPVNIVHTATNFAVGASAALAAYFGWRTEAWVERRSSPSPDRRQHVVPVEHERRLGHADRRAPGSEV
jgi:hypothetical protein